MPANTKLAGLADVVVIDFETTGLDPKKDRIVSAAAISANMEMLIENRNQQVQYWTTRMNPEQLIPAETTRIHGITNEDVANEMPFREHAESLLAFIGNRTIIAHNATFDVSFLKAELERCGMRMPAVAVTCTMHQGAQLLGRDRISLGQLARTLGLKGRTGRKHDALEDAIVTLKVATAIAVRQRGMSLSKLDVR